jgi:hypothetical protein
MDLTSPMMLKTNRIKRNYTGGMLIDEFNDGQSLHDGDYPEEWLASTDTSELTGSSGISRVLDGLHTEEQDLLKMLELHAEVLFGPEHAITFGAMAGFTCRLIDPAGPLPGDFLLEGLDHYRLWQVIKTRDSSNQSPRFYIGCREEVQVDDVCLAAERNNGTTLENLLGSTMVQEQQTYIIPPGVPAISGGGAMFLELAVSADISDELFRGVIPPQNEDARHWEVQAGPMHRSDEGCLHILGDSHQLGGALLWKAEVAGRMQITPPRPFAVILVTEGEGRMTWAGGTQELRRGAAFIQPFTVPWIEYIAHGRLSLLIAMPPAL